MHHLIGKQASGMHCCASQSSFTRSLLFWSIGSAYGRATVWLVIETSYSYCQAAQRCQSALTTLCINMVKLLTNSKSCLALQIFRGFAGALRATAPSAHPEEDAEVPAPGTSWHKCLIGLLRAFARHHYAEAAPIAKQVSAEIFSRDSGLANDVIVIANDSLHP